MKKIFNFKRGVFCFGVLTLVLVLLRSFAIIKCSWLLVFSPILVPAITWCSITFLIISGLLAKVGWDVLFDK